MQISKEQKKELISLLETYPRRSDLIKLKPETDSVKIGEAFVWIIKPFFEFVIMKLPKFEGIFGDINAISLVKLPNNLSEYNHLMNLFTTEEKFSEKQEERLRVLRRIINKRVFRERNLISNLQILIFVLLSELEEDIEPIISSVNLDKRNG